MTTNKRVVIYVRPELKDVLDAASRDSGVPVTRIINTAIEELLPPDVMRRVPVYETRKALRTATLAVGRKLRRPKRRAAA
jgi:hypothetical protein